MTRPAVWTRPFVLVVAGTAATFAGFYMLLPALPAYAATMGASRGEVGWVVAVFTFTAAGVRLVAAPHMDAWGARGFLLSGLAIFVVAAAAYAHARSFGALLGLRVLHGAGWGVTTSGLATLVAHMAPASRRGEAIGWWGMAPTLALALTPAIGGSVAAHQGYPAVFRLSAGCAAVAFVLTAILPKDAAPAGVPLARSPFAAMVPPRGVWLPAATLFLASLSYGAQTAFLPVELAGRPGRAGVWFTAFGAGILVSRPFAGRLSDAWGRRALIVPGLAVGAVSTVLLGFPHVEAAFWTSAVLNGIGIGGLFYPVLLAFTVDRAGDRRAAGLGAFMTAYDAAIATGAAALGPVYDMAGFAWMNAVAAAGVAAALVVFATGTRSRGQSEARVS